MKLFLALVFLVGSYLAFLFHTTDIVLGQITHLNNTYQYVANNADDIAAGRTSVTKTQGSLNHDQQTVLRKY